MGDLRRLRIESDLSFPSHIVGLSSRDNKSSRYRKFPIDRTVGSIGIFFYMDVLRIRRMLRWMILFYVRWYHVLFSDLCNKMYFRRIRNSNVLSDSCHAFRLLHTLMFTVFDVYIFNDNFTCVFD